MSPKHLGLLGRSIQYSASPELFAGFFARDGAAGSTYRLFELSSAADFPAWDAAHPEVTGVNVTVPFKQALLPYLHDLTPVGRTIGAVNAIRRTPHGWEGTNTDAAGFLASLRPFLASRHERALLLGDGGAAAAVRYALTSLGVRVLTAARRPDPARGVLPLADLTADALRHFPLIVQCTPVGTTPGDCLPFPFEGVTPEHLVVDLIYSPSPTTFLTRAAARGAEVHDGMDMLRAQAEEGWRWFAVGS